MIMRWSTPYSPEPETVQHLQDSLQIPTLIAHLLVQRGVKTYEQARLFFRPSFADLHDPFLMKDMDKAVSRIEKAIAENERILVFGDYDVDGTTSVALVYSYLKEFTPLVASYIPDRYLEGYGVSYKGIDFAADNEMTLIIALDCGIKSVEHVAYAQSKNIDFIICDHHLPGEIIPAAIAVLDPKQADCFYPYDELCGCGIGFKLIQALASRRNRPVESLVAYLDLVATAIAADIVPITGENRVLAKLGMEQLNSNPRPGIKALLQNRKKIQHTISDVVFGVAPRINAAGRIHHGETAVALLTQYNEEQAQELAVEIEAHNNNRRELDQQITLEALQQIEDLAETNRFSTVVFSESWHKGVIGIVASRLIENYYRPTVVFTRSGEYLAASARSVKGFDLYEALEACSAHLIQFGGHKYAAGMTCHENQYPAFKAAFEAFVAAKMAPELREPELEIDALIELADLDPKVLRLLNQFEPFGPQNRTPVFRINGVYDTGFAKAIGSKNEHVKAFLKKGQSDGVGAVGFGLGNKLHLLQNRQLVDVVFSPEENEFGGKTTWQWRLKDVLAHS